MRVLSDPPHLTFVMAKKGEEYISMLGQKATEFQQQLATEVSNTCSYFFYYNPIFIRTNFYLYS